VKTKIIQALADPTRFKIIEGIGVGEVCACEFTKHVDVSQPAVSQHLKVLLDAGLVTVRKDGTKRVYSLSPLGKKVMRDISRW